MDLREASGITDVGVDLDGVIYPFVEAFRIYYAGKVDGFDLPTPTNWYFYRDWGITDKQFAELLDDASQSLSLFSMLPPEAGTADGWNLLKDIGVRIHVITHRPPSSWAQTAEWLHLFNLIPDTLIFAKDKTVVSHFGGPGKVAMVEDYVVNHDNLLDAGVFAVLLDRPWNHGHPGVRVKSFADFAALVYDASQRSTETINE